MNETFSGDYEILNIQLEYREKLSWGKHLILFADVVTPIFRTVEERTLNIYYFGRELR